MNNDSVEEKDLNAEKLAYQIALEIRKFEIELYWKRAAYFWGFNAVAVAGYVALVKSGNSRSDVLLLSSIGMIISLAWFLVNRGSKFWQEYWEAQVEKYDEKYSKGVFLAEKKSKHKCYHIHQGYRYSVSKLNQLVSFYFVALWTGVFIISTVELLKMEWDWIRKWLNSFQISGTFINLVCIMVITVVAVIGLLKWGRGGKGEN